jgi:hypothetical protein
MILISCRKDFSNSRKFADRNAIRNYPFLPKLDQFEELDEMNLAEQMQGKHVLILIHGFRNPLQNVAASYQRVLKGLIDADLMGEAGYGLVLGFTWPGSRPRWVSFLPFRLPIAPPGSSGNFWNWPLAMPARWMSKRIAWARVSRCKH